MKYRPIVSRAGGKRRLLKYLLPLVPEHTCYVEVFGGGAALMMGKETSSIEVYNDLDQELVNLFRQAKYHGKELRRELRMMPGSRAEFSRLLASVPLTEIQAAARTLWLNKCSFGGLGKTFGTGKIGGGASFSSKSGIRHNLEQFEERFDKVVIECKSWEDLLPIYDGPQTFFFFDPPYINSAKNVGYHPFDAAQMEKLREAIDSLKAQWLITVCDSPECRRIFKGYKLKKISRMNGIENRRGHSTQYKELVITKS